MHISFERNTHAKCDCTILSLSWMGKVPDEVPEPKEQPAEAEAEAVAVEPVDPTALKLNRSGYYREGWLATGNIRGIVGVTFTHNLSQPVEIKEDDQPKGKIVRTNYNLRGHRSDVILVKWNEPYQKLASCDSSGIIFVWIKFEGRWSIELINDRNTPVTYFSWSHDGRMALICYQDGFVLVGSVAGQRYWSSMLNLEATITCGIWTPDDLQVYFGTNQGQIVVMDVHGAMVSQVRLNSEVGITGMAWSCEKFKMEEVEDSDPEEVQYTQGTKTFILAVSFQNGFIYLLKSHDDVSPIHIDTGLGGGLGVVMEWSNSRAILAVAGSVLQSSESNTSNQPNQPITIFNNLLKFYTSSGNLLYCAVIPNSQTPVSAITWGHNDKRIFIATGTQVHIAWVSRKIATLQLLCGLQVQKCLRSEIQLAALPLPLGIITHIEELFLQTIKTVVPDAADLREFVSRPPTDSVRLHCTMIRHDEDSNLSSGTCYTLYLEYLGGLIPILKGKRTSKIRPEFVIFDPQAEDLRVTLQWSPDSGKSSGSSQSTSTSGAKSESSESEQDDGCRGSPRLPRRRKTRTKTRRNEKYPERPEIEISDELAYVDTLPEEVRLVEVTSNIWGTKFKIHGLAKTVPANLGQVTYKTSLLHLQPRQMTLVMTELGDDFSTEPDPNFNPNLFSEDEEDCSGDDSRRIPIGLQTDGCPPIAPMSPRGGRGPRPQPANLTCPGQGPSPTPSPNAALARAESYEEEFPYVDLTEMVNFCESLRNTAANKLYTDNSSSQTQYQSNIRSTHQGPSYGSIVSQYARSGSSSNGPGMTPSRHAVSPLCCEGSVPTLQSPKNAVAPSDIIFDRPPAQALMSYASTTDYSNNIQQVKSALVDHSQSRTASHVNSVPFNLPLNVGQVKKMDANIENTGNMFNIMTGNYSIAGDNNSGPTKKMTKRKDGRQTATSSKQTSELQFIDEEGQSEVPGDRSVSRMRRTPTVLSISPACLADSMVRSCSVGYLDSVDSQMIPSDIALMMLRKDTQKRLVLVNRKNKKRSKKQASKEQKENSSTNTPKLKDCGKSKSLDSSDMFNNDITSSNTSNLPNPIKEKVDSPCNDYESIANLSSHPINHPIEIDKARTTKEVPKLSFFTINKTPVLNRKERKDHVCKLCKCVTVIPLTSASPTLGGAQREAKLCNACLTSQHSSVNLNEDDDACDMDLAECVKTPPIDAKHAKALQSQALANLENLFSSKMRDIDNVRSAPGSPIPPPRLPRSSPASPAPSKKGKRHQSASPIRKHILNSPLLYRRRKGKTMESSDDELVPNDELVNSKNYRDLETFQKAQLRQKLKRGKIEPNGNSASSQPAPHRREFVMHNKAPMWNENSQVYQLDFGGRVTQESAKNFQIEFRGKQVMQFGRIDGNAYTLDFQYPFSALQAFAVALANVTQRLK